MSATGIVIDPAASTDLTTPTDRTAAWFVEARRTAHGTDVYPGPVPTTMQAAYAIQDAAIARWPDRIVGWKVGMVPPAQQTALGTHRVAGPIFAANVQTVTDARSSVTLGVIPGGFAAVESEFIARIGADADPGQTDWTLAEATDMIDAVFVGVELAGSPLSTINDLGSAVVASDFGNNAGLVVGPELTDWAVRLEAVAVTSQVDATVVGRGTARDIPRGVVESVRFLLGHCAGRGMALTRGTFVSTGAVTGVHRIVAGQTAICAFDGVAEITCATVNVAD